MGSSTTHKTFLFLLLSLHISQSSASLKLLHLSQRLIFVLEFLSEFENIEGETQYSQTENFANNYLYFFMNKIAQCQNIEQPDDEIEQSYNFIELEDSQGNIYYYSNNQSIYNYYNGIGAYINYVIIDRETR